MGGVTAIITRALTDKGDFVITLTPYASLEIFLIYSLNKKVITFLFSYLFFI